MATVVQPSSKSTSTPRTATGLVTPHAVPRTRTELMTDIMSYQYPPPPNGADMDMPSSGYLPNYTVASHASSGMDPDARDRAELRRPISTSVVGPPQVHPQQSPSQQQGPAGQDASAERRRNKLGYHRTSVACGKYRAGFPKFW